MSESTNGAAPAAAEPTPAPKSRASKVDPFEQCVRAWVQEHLANSPVSQATEVWNHIQSKLGHLVEALKEL